MYAGCRFNLWPQAGHVQEATNHASGVTPCGEVGSLAAHLGCTVCVPTPEGTSQINSTHLAVKETFYV